MVGFSGIGRMAMVWSGVGRIHTRKESFPPGWENPQ
jgi:hypothetical protein